MIYVASSWRNPYYEDVVKRLKKEGFPVYDFRNPPHGGAGFHWTDVDENAPNWTFDEYADGLHHPLAEKQFGADLEAMKGADTWCWYCPAGAVRTRRPVGLPAPGRGSLPIFRRWWSRS